jgi:hypothetical protein
VHTYRYQPTGVDCAIFWGLILAGIGIGVIFQMEIGAYDYLYWPPMAFVAVMVIIGIVQVWRLQLVIDQDQVIIRRIFPGNNITLPINTIIGVDANKYTFIISTRSYGKIKLVRIGHLNSLLADLSTVGIHVTQKGETNV